jgi:hypothetical protein
MYTIISKKRFINKLNECTFDPFEVAIICERVDHIETVDQVNNN